MPKTVVTQTTVYQFDELSNAAKVKAREWFREASAQDEFWDCTFEDAVQCGAILGIEIAPRNQKNRGGYTDGKWNPNKETLDTSPAIWFSGFWSQGDGASFDGSYSYAKGAAKKIREHTGNTDAELARIADELQAIQRKHFYRVTATMKHRGHYSHSGCMDCDVYLGDGYNTGEYPDAKTGEAVTRLMRDFADWIYKQLEKEYDYQNADEQVDDNIRANEYEFTEDGERRLA